MAWDSPLQPTATVADSPSDDLEPTDPSAAVPPATPQALPALPGSPPSPVTAELSRALRAAAVRLMPQATFSPTVVGFDGGDRLLEPFDVVDNAQGYYVGWAAIRNGSVEGQFVIAIWPHADDKKSPSPGCDSAYFPALAVKPGRVPTASRSPLTGANWKLGDHGIPGKGSPPRLVSSSWPRSPAARCRP